MKSPVVARELRYRETGDESGWTVQTMLVEPTITLPRLTRGVAYDIEIRNIGLRGTASTWVSVPVTVAATATIPPGERVQELDILGGVLTIDCTFQYFRLTLSANVTSVVFINVERLEVLQIEIEQWGGGGHTINWPASVSFVAGTPYVVTPDDGATDIVTLNSTNTGTTWYLTAVQGSAGVTISPSPASDSVETDGSTPQQPSVVVTATPTSGTGHTHAWTRADTSGGTDFDIDSTTSATPTFSVPSGTTAYSATQSWRDTVTDSLGNVTQGLVAITLQRTVAGGFDLALSPSPAVGFGFYVGTSGTATVTVTATPSGASGTVSYVWTRVDPNGGSDFGIDSATRANPTFSMTVSIPVSRTQTWRCTATDSGTSAVVAKDVEVTLEVTA